MRKNILLFATLFILLILSVDTYAQNLKGRYTNQDATIVIDAFNKNFYNPEMKLYATTSDLKGRAAIWTQAIYWDMIMNAYKRTGDTKYKDLLEEIYQGGYEQYDAYNWDNVVEWFIYDDLMWWIISLARAYEITGEQKYLGHSILGFDRVWYGSHGVEDNGSYDAVDGGLYWGWYSDQRGKTACINYPTVVAASTLYNITKDADYLDKAIEIYEWSRNTLFDKNDGKVADHKVGKEPTNWETQLYNQATAIGGGVMLYKITGDKLYLDDAILMADYVKNVMCDQDGILPFKNGIEQGIYCAIFAQYIIRLIEDGKQPQYLSWLKKNIDTGWYNRDMKRNLTFKDFGVKTPEGIVEVYDASGIPALMQVVPAQ